MSPRELEILAPAGNPEVLRWVVEAGADAVYLGGKRFNMRLLRPEFNFSDQELAEAVSFLHQRQKKMYITVNNLYKHQEIDDIKDYLLYLGEIGADALIIQDLGLIKLCQELHLEIPLHASVQMGINNLAAVKVLEDSGFSRIILSKNLTLDEIKAIHAGTELGIEYFVHGDLCVSHTGQCYMSSFLFGESGNRGRCRKPCRWSYKISGLPGLETAEPQYYLAHKDLCLFPHLADMINAGVSSFKIEGRMRTGEQLAFIVGAYRRAADNYLNDPQSYAVAKNEYEELQTRRVRDYTSGSLYKNICREDIGLSGAREPLFPTAPVMLKKSAIEDLSEIGGDLSRPEIMPELTVKVGGMQSLEKMLELGVNNIILSLDSMRQQDENWTFANIQAALDKKSGYNSKILIETPRIVSQCDLADIYTLLEQAFANQVDAWLVNDLGSLRIAQTSGLPVWTGYGLNISNVKAGAFLKQLGADRIAVALETNADDLQQLLQTEKGMELLVQGPLPGIITDLCLARINNNIEDECRLDCVASPIALVDEYGQAYKVYSDYQCRNYINHPLERALYPYLDRFIAWGIKSLRIDGQNYSPELLARVVVIYQQALADIQENRWIKPGGYKELLSLFPDGLTTAPVV